MPPGDWVSWWCLLGRSRVDPRLPPSLLLSAATSWRLGVVVVVSGVSEILCVVARLRPSFIALLVAADTFSSSWRLGVVVVVSGCPRI